MKNDELYMVLIYYFIFLTFQKAYSATLDVDLIADIIPNSRFDLYLDIFRQILSATNLMIIFYLFYNFKLNIFLIAILSILLIKSVCFFLLEKKYIYYITNKKSFMVEYFSKNFPWINLYLSLIYIAFGIYLIYKIFNISKVLTFAISSIFLLVSIYCIGLYYNHHMLFN
jgi:hypothetical protein